MGMSSSTFSKVRAIILCKSEGLELNSVPGRVQCIETLYVNLKTCPRIILTETRDKVLRPPFYQHAIFSVTCTTGEIWVMDFTGNQFGYKDTLISWNTYRDRIKNIDKIHLEDESSSSATSFVCQKLRRIFFNTTRQLKVNGVNLSTLSQAEFDVISRALHENCRRGSRGIREEAITVLCEGLQIKDDEQRKNGLPLMYAHEEDPNTKPHHVLRLGYEIPSPDLRRILTACEQRYGEVEVEHKV